MRYLLSLSLLFLQLTAVAQDSSNTPKYHYFGLHGIGLQVGGSTQSGSLLTTNGIATGNWYTGITTGIDWYGVRSIPVLATVYKAFGKTRKQPFLYGSAGLSCPWEKPDYYGGFSVSDASYKNSFMGEVGLGYFIPLKNQTAISLSVGYSYKTVRVKGAYQTFTPWGIAPYNVFEYDNTTHYRRLAIRLGIRI